MFVFFMRYDEGWKWAEIHDEVKELLTRGFPIRMRPELYSGGEIVVRHLLDRDSSGDWPGGGSLY